jgi:hypothetical protein
MAFEGHDFRILRPGKIVRIRILVSVLPMRRCFVGIASDSDRAIMIADLIASRYIDII